MITDDEKQLILKELTKDGYSIFQTELWDSKFRSDLVELLKSNGFQIFKFYKLALYENKYVVVLGGAEKKIAYLELEKEYSIKRGVFKRLLPLMITLSPIALLVLYASAEKDLMGPTIILLIPTILGALFTYVFIQDTPKPLFNWSLKVPSIVVLIVLGFSVIVLREGVICLIIMIPIIFIATLIGTLFMRFICFALWKPTAKIYSLALLPLLLYFILPDFTRNYFGQTQREMIIHAPQAQVFQAINHIGKIQPEEVPNNFIFTMGFPKPIFGMTEQRATGLVRTIQWERGVQFEEQVQANHAPYLLSWNYQFDAHSFPKGSLDDHVEVGGKYFDLLKTDYQLEQIDAKTTKLILTIDYRVSTEFNWYSRLWVNYILGEFSDVVMTIHKHRLEKS